MRKQKKLKVDAQHGGQALEHKPEFSSAPFATLCCIPHPIPHLPAPP